MSETAVVVRPAVISAPTPEEPLVISHSDIESFLRCRRLFTFGYALDYQAHELEWGALALGKRVHRAIDVSYRTGADPVEEHDRLGRADVAAVEGRPHTIWQLNQLYEDIVVGRNCVVAYMTWLADEGPDDGLELVASEEKVEAPILGGLVLLRGMVDRKFIRASDGAIIIDDLKTSGVWRTGHRERLERSYQHHVYLAILRLLHREERWVAGATYTIVNKVKNLARVTTPMVHRFPTPATERLADVKLRQIEQICVEMLAQIERVRTLGARVAAYPTPQEACRWCPFRHPCELLDESATAAKDMLDSRDYTRGRRLERYGDVID